MLDKIKSAKKVMPRRTVLYGVHGIGKSTWASKWPSPVFVATEDGLSDIDVPAFPLATTLQSAWEPVLTLGGGSHDYKTIVIDTADWLEKLIWEKVCNDGGKESISDFGYGTGYAASATKFRKYLASLDQCRAAGMNVVVIAHSAIVKFEDPSGDSYDRYTPKLHKECAAVLQEWADEVLFCNYQTHTKEVEKVFDRERHIGIGSGKRMIYTSERPSHQAKNRLGLPAEMPFDFELYAKHLPGHVHDPDIGLPGQVRMMVDGVATWVDDPKTKTTQKKKSSRVSKV